MRSIAFGYVYRLIVVVRFYFVNRARTVAFFTQPKPDVCKGLLLVISVLAQFFTKPLLLKLNRLCFIQERPRNLSFLPGFLYY